MTTTYVEESKQIYLRRARCVHRADKEPALLVLDQGNEEVFLIFGDGDVRRVVNVSEDRGSI